MNKRMFFLFALLLIVFCQKPEIILNTQINEASESVNLLQTNQKRFYGQEEMVCDFKAQQTGNYSLHAWSSGSFSGSMCRTWKGDVDYLIVEVHAEDGGTDAGIVDNLIERIYVDDFDFIVPSPEVVIGDSISGMWWMGPKINIYKPGTNGLSGNYETYIIENAYTTPEAFVSRIVSGGVFLGETEQDGGIYKHYRKQHHTITQFFAVRTQWRNTGTFSMKPTLALWRANGLNNWRIEHFRIYNIETYQKTDGIFTITYDQTGTTGVYE